MVNKDLLEAQNKIIGELKAIVEDLKRKLEKLGGQVEKLERQVGGLENQQREAVVGGAMDERSWSNVLKGSKVKGSEYHADVLNVVGLETKARKQKEQCLMVFGLQASTELLEEDKLLEDKKNVGDLFNSFDLGNLAEKIVKVHRFKSEPNKAAPVHVTMEWDLAYGEGSPVSAAKFISKAAKCLKDSTKYRSVYINPDLTHSQQIHLKSLIKERTESNSKLDLGTSEFRYGIRGDYVVKINNRF